MLIYLVSALVVLGLNEMPRSPLIDGVTRCFSPPLWHGVTLDALSLPMFLFVAGAAIVPAFKRHRSFLPRNVSRTPLVWARIVRRVLLLLAIGLLCEGGFFQHWPHLRFVGAFQRIAICYAIVASLHLTTGWRFQAALLAFLLIDYWVILAFGGSDSDPAAIYSWDSNAAAYVDTLFLPGRKYFGGWDRDGIVTTIPAVVITLSGLLAGDVLAGTLAVPSEVPNSLRSQSGEAGEAPSRFRIGKNASLCFAGTGIAAIASGFLAGLVCPINVYLWTPTFCLVAIGAALVMLSIFHAGQDVQRCIGPAKLLRVFGTQRTCADGYRRTRSGTSFRSDSKLPARL